jgi:putative DNA primase/helicase
MTADTCLDAALGYARRGWHVFPMTHAKKPLTAHGLLDATKDKELIRQWWNRHPFALVAIATGMSSGVVALDVDVRPSGSGVDSLEDLCIVSHPLAPTAHTPSGGLHIFFAAPAHEVRSSTAKLAPLLDVRADGGSVILPPGPGRFWDPILNLDTRMLPAMPSWMVIPEVVRSKPNMHRMKQTASLSRYGEAALDCAVKRIVEAPAGRQEVTLNREAYAIGQLASSGYIPPGLALEAMLWAAHRVPCFDRRRPWRAAELERKVEAAFSDGLLRPREARNDRR